MKSSIGILIDTLYELRQERLSYQRMADERGKQEKIISDQIILDLKEVELDAGRGKLANFSYKKVETPNVENWNKVYEFIQDNNDFGLLQKRITVPQWNQYKDDGIIVPGTAIFEATKFSLTKLGR